MCIRDRHTHVWSHSVVYLQLEWEIVVCCYTFVFIENGYEEYLTEEEINEIINNSGSDIDLLVSNLEISENDCQDNGDIVIGEASDIANTSQFLLDIIENCRPISEWPKT